MILALERIAERLEELSKAADELHPMDPHQVHVCAVQLRAQAEMIRKGLCEGIEPCV